MSMRITTNGVFHGYRSDLASSYYKMNKSMTRVTTQRNFSAYAEDVSAASRAFQLRRSHWRTETQINNSNYVISKFETAWTAMDYIVDGTGADDNLNSIVESLRGLNSPTGAARVPLGQSVLSKADSIVRLLNSQYGDQFLFAGADGKNVPFAWETGKEGEYLTFRGIDVSTPVGFTEDELADHVIIEALKTTEADGTETITGYKLRYEDALNDQGFELTGSTATYTSQEDAEAALQELSKNPSAEFANYKEQFNEKYASYTHDQEGATAYDNGRKLLEMSQEATYVDIGTGMDWYEDGDLIPSSAYNSALSGLNFLGFGSTLGEDGKLHSNNLAVLMVEMGNMLQNCDSDTGAWPEGWDIDRVSALTKMIDTAVDSVSVQHVKLSADTSYLQTNLTQLTAQRDNLNEQILDIEQINPADAISEFLYARYAYNAALSVGNSILTNTLLDYLR